jgi:RimJ/RimL family protein N-acetyltransferase
MRDFMLEEITIRHSNKFDYDNILNCIRFKETQDLVSIIPHHNQEGFVSKWIEFSVDKGNYTIETTYGHFIGCAGLHITKNSHSAEIGYFLHPSFQGQGIGKRVVKILIEKAQSKSLIALFATAAVDNIPSIKVLEKNGFSLHDTVNIKTARGVYRHSLQFKIELFK